MGEIIEKTNILRDRDYLYYIAYDKDGYLLIGKAILKRGGRPRKIKNEIL